MPRGQFDRSARKAKTRTQLLEAAATVYARKGFDAATLEEVATEAGYTKGAVYGHFGSKEALLRALLQEHLAGQIQAQIELFDPERETWERPIAGSNHWMLKVRENPDPFRLFVELWIHSQRNEQLREQLAGDLQVLRETFTRFASLGAADAGVESSDQAAEQFANVALGLGIGLSMLKLADFSSVPDALLGSVLQLLIWTLESSPASRTLLGHPEESLTGTAGE